ncbi:MAG: ABC transporter permease [Bdellovibrio sp. CG10_big_fil_rev_8_21_14_0_10_47_8]|nr:MAG: ABC transporter permease [Bdellovibrio sp. CG10_big_fil_rev_8_21_14_0_10_47_8]
MTADKMNETRQLTAKEKHDLEHVLPMWKIVWQQFTEHRMAVIGLCVIIFFVLIAAFAPVIKAVTGLDPEAQNPLSRYQPPLSRTMLPTDQRNDKVLEFENMNPNVAAELRKSLIEKSLVQSASEEDALYDLVAQKNTDEIREAMKLIPTEAADKFLPVVNTFETMHVFGTDELGRDVLMRLIYGTRVSMSVGLMVAFFSAFVGLLIGAVAGYYGGVMDAVLMRVTDALLSLPTLPFLIVMAAIDLNKVPLFKSLVGSENESIVKMVTILLLFSWMTIALLVRGSILSLREREFILAAKTLGAKDSTIIFRHMFPNVIAPMLVSVTLGVGNAILFESALSFLGLGIQPPTPSWGNMLYNAQELISEAPFLAFLPGLLILATVISFNYLGDGLQDAIDPKAIRR